MMSNFPRLRSRGIPLPPAPPAPPPAWLSSQPLNTLFEISGTSGAGGSAINEYCGLARVGNKWIAAAAGGHNYSDNRVSAIDLSADAPAWSVLKAASTSIQQDVAYYPDGKPSSSHLYFMTHGISGNRVLNVGRRVPYVQGDFNSVDAFNLDTNQWEGVVPDSPGTSGSGWPNITPSGRYCQAQDHNGDVWAVQHDSGSVAKLTVTTKTWSQPAMANTVSPNVRYPWALDTLRSQMFGLAWGDGEGTGSGMRAVVLTQTTQIAISFDAGSSSAVSQFASDTPKYAGMDYDQANDRFLFYSTDNTNRIYEITPNNTAVWSMAILSTTGALPASTRPLVKRLTYFPEFKTFAILLGQEFNIYGLRVAL